MRGEYKSYLFWISFWFFAGGGVVWMYYQPLVTPLKEIGSTLISDNENINTTTREKVSELKPQLSIHNIKNRPLFVESRTPPKSVQKAVAKPLPKEPPEFPKGQLVGFVSVPDGKFVLYEDEEKVFKRLGIGEWIGGWQIKEIHEKEVSFIAEIFTHTLKLIDVPALDKPRTASGISFIAPEGKVKNTSPEASLIVLPETIMITGDDP